MPWMILLRLVLPFVQKYAARYAADYLESWRERRRQLSNLEESLDCPPCPPCPTAGDGPFSRRNKVWYGLSGILLGGAFGLIGYLLLRPNNNEATL